MTLPSKDNLDKLVSYEISPSNVKYGFSKFEIATFKFKVLFALVNVLDKTLIKSNVGAKS